MEKISEVAKASARVVVVGTKVTGDQFKSNVATVSLHLTWLNEVAVR